jgi:hypothetical protein
MNQKWYAIPALALCLALSAGGLNAAETGIVRYYRQLAVDRDTPMLEYDGIFEINFDQAHGADHYEFTYDLHGRITEIVNLHDESCRRNSLTDLGAYRTTFTYDGEKEIHRFYDRAGKRVANLRKAYEEVYTHTPEGFKTALEFHDLDGRPMESDRGIARYTWEKKNGLVIERRYNLKGDPVPLAPGLPFRVSGLRLDHDGRVKAHLNLNDKLRETNDENGVASSHNLYAENGNLLGFTYFAKDGRPTNSGEGYAIGRFTYDANGNLLSVEFIDKEGRLVSRETYSYDEAGKVIGKK